MRPQNVTVFALLIAGAAVRVAFLDADPAYYQWIGYITDEGRWSEHARAIAQSGALTDQGPLHLVLAPLYQVISWVGFEVFGVSYASARLPAALSGCLLMLVLWRLCARTLSPFATAVALAFVAFHADYVMLSRIAIPEMSAMAASLIAFATLLSERPPRTRLLFAGVWVGVAIALKATVLPVLGIFAVVAMCDAPAGSRWSERLRRGAWLIAPVSLGGVALLAAAAPLIVDRLEWLLELHILEKFLGVRPLFVTVEVLLRGVITAPLCMAAIGAWAAGIGALALRPAGDAPRTRLARGAAIWAGLYLPLTLCMQYFPDRYIVHIFTPLVLLTAVGVDWLIVDGWSGLTDAVSRARRDRGWPALAWIALPSALPLAPVPVAALTQLGFEPRVRFLLAAIALVWLFVTMALARWRDRDAVRRFAIAFPVATTLIWSLNWALWDDPFGFWPATAGDGLGARAAARAALGAAFAAGFALRPPRPRVAVAAASAALAAIWLAHLSPQFLDRHYTLSEISEDIGALLGTRHVIDMNAEGLFLENEVRYRWVPPDWPETRTEYFVTAMRYWGDEALLRKLYEPVAHYDPYISPRFAALQPDYWIDQCLTVDGHMVSVYRLRDPSLATE